MNIIKHLRMARALGLKESLKRLPGFLKEETGLALKHLHWKYYPPTFPEEEFIHSYGMGDQKSACRNWIKYVKNTILGENFQGGNPNTGIWEELKKIVVPYAEKIVEGRFDILGHYDVRLGIPPNWSADFKSTFRWDNTKMYYKIAEQTRKGADLKVPWELSMSHWLISLGVGWRLTRDEKFPRCAKILLLDWIEKNKVGRGVNWECPMPIGMRAANWLWGLALFENSPLFDDQTILKIAEVLWLTGKFISDHYEGTTSFRSNHYLGDLIGVFHIGLAFKKMKMGQTWLDYTIREFCNQINKQVYEDGGDFEASVPYHRLVLEFFTLFGVLAKRNNLNIDSSYFSRLKKMSEFVKGYLRPDGECPQIGDNDSGRQFIVHPSKVNDHRYLLCWGAVLFEDSNFKIEGVDFSSDSLILFGEDSYNIWKNLKMGEPPRTLSFRDFGIYIMRDFGHKFQLTIFCGSIGQTGFGGHSHNDKLSIDLVFKGMPFIVDPGTGVYTPDPEKRIFFRATKSHSTISIDGFEQAEFNINTLFSLLSDPKAKCLKWDTNNTEKCSFSGEHYGWMRLSNPLIHRREIVWDKIKGEVAIVDKLLKLKGGNSGKLSISSNIILHPDVVIKDLNKNKVVLENKGVLISIITSSEIPFKESGAQASGGKSNADLLVGSEIPFKESGVQASCLLKVEDWLYSCEYGKWVDTKKLSWQVSEKIFTEGGESWKILLHQ